MGKIFRFVYEGKSIRTIISSTQPAFVFRDVCVALNVQRPALTFAALKDNERETLHAYDGEERQRYLCVNSLGVKAMLDMYPNGIFERWFNQSVLPQIRNLHREEQERLLPKNYVEALEMLLNTEKQLEQLTSKAEQQPTPSRMTDFNVENALTMNQVAKTLRFGRNRLFVLLREKGYLMKDNTPYQKFLEQKLFAVRTVMVQGKTGLMSRTQTLVTTKGLARIQKLLAEQRQDTIAQ